MISSRKFTESPLLPIFNPEFLIKSLCILDGCNHWFNQGQRSVVKWLTDSQGQPQMRRYIQGFQWTWTPVKISMA